MSEQSSRSSAFLSLVSVEVDRKRAGGKKKKIHSYHEAWGKIQEEVNEFAAEVAKKEGKRDGQNALHELVQIAANAMRAAEDLGLIKYTDDVLRSVREA